MCLVKITYLCNFMLLNMTAFLNTTSEKFTMKYNCLLKKVLRHNRIVYKDTKAQSGDNFTTLYLKGFQM